MNESIRVRKMEKKLSDAVDSINTLYEGFPDDFESFLKNKLIKNGLYKEAEHAIQCIIDICAMINADLRMGIPETEDSIFDYLERGSVFSKEVISIIREMKKFRNVLVHRYGEIDDVKAFDSLQEGKNDFKKVIEEIESFLKKSQEGKKKNQ